MAIYEVFSHSILLRYKTSICSKATVFYVIVTLLTIISPFLITYRSQGFWKKVDFYREQPDIHFKHKVILVLETSSLDSFIVWSSYPKLNQRLTSNVKMRIPLIQHIEEDADRDGRNDKLWMSIEVPLAEEDIVSIKLILVFDYKLHLYSSFQMESLAYITYSSPLPGSSLDISGELTLIQREPLKHRGKDTRYNKPVIDETKNDIDAYKLENVLNSYSARNVSTMFNYVYPVWKAGRGINEPFKIMLTMFYKEETIQYRVGFWQLLKWAWIQYLSVLVLFWYAFRRIKIFVFQKQLVPTILFSPLKQNV